MRARLDFLAFACCLMTSVNALSGENVKNHRTIATDFRGVPLLCGSDHLQVTASASQMSPSAKPHPPPPPTVLPSGMRAWECVPSVIRADGVDSFCLEVDVNGIVSNVVLTLTSDYLRFVSGINTQNLRDDGLNGDRVAGDRIFTSEWVVFTNRYLLPANLFYDT